MKHTTHFIFALFLFSLLFSIHAIAQDANQQKQSKTEKVKEMVAAHDFIFTAKTALPMTGKTRILTSPYDLQISKDSIISYLPYFGRAYSAPIDPSKGGIKFTSTQFEYKEENKKDGWDVFIKPRDVTEVQQLLLHISSEGYATLQVISTQRQPISFYGEINERKIKKAF
jgi:hypothetical protein